MGPRTHTRCIVMNIRMKEGLVFDGTNTRRFHVNGDVGEKCPCLVCGNVALVYMAISIISNLEIVLVKWRLAQLARDAVQSHLANQE